MKNVLSLKIVMIFILFSSSLFAKELTGLPADKKIKGAERILINERSDAPEFIVFRQGSQPEISKFKNLSKEWFGLSASYDLREIGREKDQLGMIHYRYVETLNGYDLEGTMYIVHTKNNKIVSLNGTLYNQVQPASVALTESDALSKALEYVHADVYLWKNPGNEASIKQITGDPASTWYPKGKLMFAPQYGIYASSSYRLAYRFDIYAEKPLSRQYVFVDASTGEVIHTTDRIKHANSIGTAVTQYSGVQSFTTDSVNATSYRLRASDRGLGIQTYNLQQGTTYSNTDFTDTDNYWNNVNAQLDEYAADAHYGAEATYDFYFTRFGRNSIDDNGYQLLNYVHYDVNFLNAFWDGTRMTYGDGDGAAYTPLTSLDVTGHEITHGLTEFTSNLGANEAGALNESFSDCMGNTIRHMANPSAPINWLIGDQLGGTPFRSMSNPNAYGDPDTYLGTNWDFATQEVHKNSTVMSFCYYLLTEGGSGTNDNGDAYSVTGVGIDTSSAIFYRMNTVYLFPNAGYADARTYAIQAAIDLYGPCTDPVIQTTNAWHAVGVGNVFSPVVTSDFIATDSVYCSAPATVSFSNQSVNAGYFTWDFGDGSQSTATNPTHVYNNYGIYTVRLISDGGSCGIDSITRVQYINIDEANPCLISLPVTSTSGPTQTSCSGFLYDNGGSAGDYTDQTDNSITISPTGATNITLTFASFDLENNYDYLYVYDGPSTASPQIGRYTGSTLPAGGTITSSGGSVTIRMTSDQAVTAAGFSLTWQCTLSNAPPVPAFSANTTNSCSGTISFTDNSTAGPTSWLWDFGDGSTSTVQNPSHTYTFSGMYDVKLIVSNSNGSDSLIQSAYITINLPAAPTPGASVSECPGQSQTLGANGSGTLVWFDAPTGGNQVGTGTLFTTPALNASTNYYVESQIAAPSVYGGPADNTFGTGAYYATTAYRCIYFNCSSPSTLVSVKVYAQTAGAKTITLIQSGTTLRSINVNIPAGTSRVTLNWSIPVGSNYELGCAAPSGLYRNQGGATFPYNVSGLLSLTGTNATGNQGYYYFFYDWEVVGPPCVSERTTVPAIVLPQPTASFNTYVGTDTAYFTDLSSNAVSWSWDFGDPSSGADNTSSLLNPIHMYSNDGNYNTCLIVSNSYGCTDTICQNVQVLINNLNDKIITDDLSVYPNPTSGAVSIHLTKNVSGPDIRYLTVQDLTGRILLHVQIEAGLGSEYIFLDLSELSSGTYILTLHDGKKKANTRLIRQ